MNVCEASPEWERLMKEHADRSEALVANGQGEAILWLPFGKGIASIHLFHFYGYHTNSLKSIITRA